MNYKTSYWLMRILGIGGILVMLIGGITGRTVIGVLGIICVLVGTLQMNFFYHAPTASGICPSGPCQNLPLLQEAPGLNEAAMDYKKSYTLLWVGLIAGFVLMLIGVFLEIGWLLWPGAVVVMADVLQTLLFFRCPYCGGHWDPRGGIPHYCPECGEYIR